ncbi:MAG TPA: lysylphosphatidylglycerol synthase transmembrane domain-containing protein [Polyangiales bacterium]|nr:lysylphosphatidylglycerol synthase transmembrane domain-containing protein [Polyangiales bacterium]
MLGANSQAPASARRTLETRWLGLLLGALALAGLYFVARNLDWAATLRTLHQLGARAPLIVLPYAVVLSCDTLGWRFTFEKPRELAYATLWRVRVATEAVANSLPAGPALAETVKAFILQRRLGLQLSAAAGNVVLAKFALAISQSLFLIVALALAMPTLSDNSHAVLGREGLEWYALGVAFGFLLIVCLGLWSLSHGRLLSRFTHHGRRLGGGWLRHRLERLHPRLERIEHAFGAFARVPQLQSLAAIVMFSCGWVCLGCENFVILRLLGSDVTPGQAISMEAVLSVVRIVFFLVPSALGAQEAGYYLVLRAYGVSQPEVVAAAFMLAKRTKELVWIGIGYSVLSSLHVRVRDAAAGRPVTRP